MKNMTKIAAGAALGLWGTMAQAADDVTLQLKWVTQAQFAGYYVALDKGFYEEEGLNVTIKPGGPGVWFFGNEYPFYAWMASLGLETDGADDNGVTVLKQAFSADPLIQGQADCISTMTYNEYRQILQAGITPEELVTFNYLDMGFGMLEDGLYVLEDDLEDPEFKDKMVRFVRASMKGWKYAEENQEEAAEIVVENDASGAQELDHQLYMVGEVAKLTAGSNGTLDEADYDQTVKTLLSAVSEENPAITKEPEGAWTHEITDEALN